MSLGETLAADIILSVTDKHGNKTGKVSAWNLKLFFDFSLCFAAWKGENILSVNDNRSYYECYLSSSKKKPEYDSNPDLCNMHVAGQIETSG